MFGYGASFVEIDFVVEFFRLRLVGHLIVFLVNVVAKQTVDCEENPRQLVERDNIVAIQVIETEDKAFCGVSVIIVRPIS